MRILIALLACALIVSSCAAPRTYTRPTPYALADAFDCALRQMQQLEYDIVLADTVGGLLQARREITGIREAARRGAAAATEILTAGLAGGSTTRYDELTVFVFTRVYPQGNTLEITAGMLNVGDGGRTRADPSDSAREDARTVANLCGMSN